MMVKLLSKAFETIAEKTASLESNAYIYAPKVPTELKARMEKKVQSNK
jgi:cyclic lactone autoinducer peptide